MLKNKLFFSGTDDVAISIDAIQCRPTKEDYGGIVHRSWVTAFKRMDRVTRHFLNGLFGDIFFFLSYLSSILPNSLWSISSFIMVL